MNLSSFNAGKPIKTGGFRAFAPEKINQRYVYDDAELLPLIEKINLKIGELNSFLELIPDSDRLVSLFMMREAIASCKIDGSRLIIDDVLLFEKELSPGKRNDWRSVNHYVQALRESLQQLKETPLTLKVMLSAHKKLSNGEKKFSGEFRQNQIWQGSTTIQKASFVPPVSKEIEELMEDLENFFFRDDTGLPNMIKVAFAIYQIETISPFADDNGKMARLIFPLYLMHKKIIPNPILFISDYVEKNRSAYEGRLAKVRSDNDLHGWLSFILTGAIDSCGRALDDIRKAVELKKDIETRRLPKLERKQPRAKKIIDSLFTHPVIRPDRIAEICKISAVSTYKLLDDLIKLGILREMTGNKRNRIFIFREYVDIFK